MANKASRATLRAMQKALSDFMHDVQTYGNVLKTAADTLVSTNGSDNLSLKYSQELNECINELYKVGTTVESFFNGLTKEIQEIDNILNM